MEDKREQKGGFLGGAKMLLFPETWIEFQILVQRLNANFPGYM